MYACKIQDWKFGSVLTTAYPADSRKACCKVCNNAIINRLFAFNCCKKDQNNTENLSEWTSFGAVNTLRRQGSTILFKMHHVLLSRAPASERISPVSRQKCHAKLFSQHSSVLLLLRNVVRDSDNFFASLFSLEVKFLWRNAFACGKVWAGSFAVLVFLHSSILAFGSGHTIKQLPWGPSITRLLHAPELDQVYRSWWKLQASVSQQEPVLGLCYLNGSWTLREPHASVDGDNVDLYTF